MSTRCSMRSALLTAALFCAAGAASPAAHAQIGDLCSLGFNNCQEVDVTTGSRSSNDIAFNAADDFIPFAAGNITTVCWWGAYGMNNVVADDFEITVFENDNGLPGTVVGNFSQAGGTLDNVMRFDTGIDIPGPVTDPLRRLHEYTAVLEGGLAVQAECYWIEIRHNGVQGNAGNNWVWKRAFSYNGRALQGNFGVPYDAGDAVPEDFAFCVSVNLDFNNIGSCLPPPVKPPDNDACADATVIGPAPVTVTYDTGGASTDANEGQNNAGCTDSFNNSAAINGDVWYRWTAAANGIATISSCDLTLIDSKIAVYEGFACPPPEASLVACVDDLCLAPQGQTDTPASVTFPAEAGQEYLIQFGGSAIGSRGPGQFTLTVDAATGACCAASGCVQVTAPDCAAMGGEYEGDLTSCNASYAVAEGAAALEDISGSGTLVEGLPDDAPAVDAPIGFDFNFFGNLYDTVGVSPNGQITFDSPVYPFANNFPIPSPTVQPNGFVALAWDDLLPADGGGAGEVYYRTDGAPGSRRFIVQYEEVQQFAGACCLTYQVILYEATGNIEVRYENIIPAELGSGYVIGIESPDGMEGVPVDPATIENGDSLLFTLNDDPDGICGGDDCIADFDNSGTVDSNDYFAFLTAFFNGDPSADVDGVSGINSNDYFFFLTAFFEGCP